MEVISGGTTGRAHFAEEITGFHRLAGGDVNGREMIVAAVQTEAMVENDRPATYGELFGQNYFAGGWRTDFAAGVGAVICSFMVCAVRSPID